MSDPRKTGYGTRDLSRTDEGAGLVDDDDDAVDSDDDDTPSSEREEQWFSRSSFGTLEWWLHT